MNCGRKKLIKLIIITFLVTTLFSGTLVYAAEIDGSVLTNEGISEKVEENLGRGNILHEGVARITDNGSGSVNVYGAVLGYVVCDKMILEMTLQRLQNGTWVDVKYYSDTVYNQSYLAKSYNASVSKGYYYRVKVACVAQKGSTVESKMPVTNGIWID